MLSTNSRMRFRMPVQPMHSHFPLGTSLLTRQGEVVETNALLFPHVIFTSNDTTIVHHGQTPVERGLSSRFLKRDPGLLSLQGVWFIHFRYSAYY